MAFRGLLRRSSCRARLPGAAVESLCALQCLHLGASALLHLLVDLHGLHEQALCKLLRRVLGEAGPPEVLQQSAQLPLQEGGGRGQLLLSLSMVEGLARGALDAVTMLVDCTAWLLAGRATKALGATAKHLRHTVVGPFPASLGLEELRLWCVVGAVRGECNT